MWGRPSHWAAHVRRQGRNPEEYPPMSEHCLFYNCSNLDAVSLPSIPVDFFASQTQLTEL